MGMSNDDGLLAMAAANDHETDCIYGTCDVSLRDRQQRIRHLIDCHDHSYKSAVKSIDEAEDDAE